MICCLILFAMVMKMFRQAMVVFLKEMKCIVRDTKTFLLGLLMPLILVPGLLFIVNLSLGSLMPGDEAGVSVKMCCSSKDNSFYKFLSSQSRAKLVEVKDYKKALNSGEIDVYVKIDPTLDQKILENKGLNLDELIQEQYNSATVSNTNARVSMSKYRVGYGQIIDSVLEQGGFGKIEDINTSVSVDTDGLMDSGTNSIADMMADINLLCFALLVPTMIILYCGTSSMGTAGELGVGEKERGTLEALLSTGANRTSIVLGKLFATTSIGAMGGLCAVIGLCCYMLMLFGGNSSQLTFSSCIYLVLITLCVALFFSSIHLTLSVYSKSNKEAQTYALPVVMICIAPTFFTYTLNPVDIDYLKLSIPVYNVACILKEILASSANLIHVVIVCAWLIIYALIAVAIMIRLFKREDVIFRV